MDSCERIADLTDRTSQFLLTRSETIAAPGWTVREIGEWRLSHHTALAWTEIVARDGMALGRFLGTVLTDGGTVPVERIVAPFETADGLDPLILEDFIYSHGGRWIFFQLDPVRPRVFLDAIGTLALVFDTETQRAAATTTLLDPHAGFGRDWLGLEDQPFPIPNHYYPSNLTGRQGFLRLLPNFVLDLEAMTVSRHWPRADIPRVETEAEVRECIDVIVTGMKASMKALTSIGEVTISLTAGRDSRMLLACCREIVDQIECFTFDFDTLTGPVDLDVARLLCERHGIVHTTVPIIDVTEAEEQLYLERTGYPGHPGKVWDFYVATRGCLDLSRYWLVAFSSEVGRAVYWKKRDVLGGPLDPVDLLGRGGLPPVSKFVEAMRTWIDELEGTDIFVMLDLLALEHRGGGWAMAHLHGTAPFRDVIVPYARRSIMEAMMRLPLDYRRNQRMAHDVIAATWPELNALPFQRTPGLGGRWRLYRDMTLRPKVLKMMEGVSGLRQSSRMINALYLATRRIYRSLRR